MKRGYIYEVCSSKKDLGNLSESDLHEDLQSLGVDYVQDIDKEEQVDLREHLARYFQKHGALIKKINVEDVEGEETYEISRITQQVKESCYEKRFQNLKDTIAATNLSDFSSYSINSSIYKLKTLVEDNYGDMVYKELCPEIMDNFIRTADPKKKYYLGNVVLLH